MFPYRLDFQEHIKRQLKNVRNLRVRKEIAEGILDLREEPYPPKSTLERELSSRRRLKINGWRVIYKVKEEDKVVVILAICRRSPTTYLNVP